MKQEQIPIITVQTAASINSTAIPAMNLLSCSAQLIGTGSAAGTMKLQASNDNPLSGGNVPTNWNDIPSATVSVSGAGSYLIPKTDICYEYVRVVYTNSGTGTIAVNFKSIGG